MNIKEGESLFIGLRGINGTLTAFLGLLTNLKRKPARRYVEFET